MKTYEEQERFFVGRKDGLMSVFKNGGGGVAGAMALVNAIMETPDLLERRVLFMFIRGELTIDVIGPEGLDALITVVDAAIAENMRQWEELSDTEAKDKRLDSTIPMSYNLAADLAFCWGDGFKREKRHFERGLAAGEFCLKWRTFQGKPAARRFAMCHWVCGVHRLAVGDVAGARADFKKSMVFDCEAAGVTGEVVVDGKTPEAVLLIRGWIAIVDGEKELLERILGMFEERLKSGDKEVSGGAKWALIQLREGNRAERDRTGERGSR